MNHRSYYRAGCGRCQPLSSELRQAIDDVAARRSARGRARTATGRRTLTRGVTPMQRSIRIPLLVRSSPSFWAGLSSWRSSAAVAAAAARPESARAAARRAAIRRRLPLPHRGRADQRVGHRLRRVRAASSRTSARKTSSSTKTARQQTITHFNAERVPVSLGIALDTSGSMAGEKFEHAQAALDRFLFDLLDQTTRCSWCASAPMRISNRAGRRDKQPHQPRPATNHAARRHGDVRCGRRSGAARRQGHQSASRRSS